MYVCVTRGQAKLGRKPSILEERVSMWVEHGTLCGYVFGFPRART